jgi:hypothetical protein
MCHLVAEDATKFVGGKTMTELAGEDEDRMSARPRDRRRPNRVGTERYARDLATSLIADMSKQRRDTLSQRDVICSSASDTS